MPWLTSGKFETREELVSTILRLYHQGDTLRSIAYKCQISTRSGHRILRQHGLAIGERPAGARPKPPKIEMSLLPQQLSFVRKPCWKSYCDDPKCIHHQQVNHV
jgi:hypothetical protein